MYRRKQYYSECFICTVDMPFVDTSPQICQRCRKARPDIASDGLGEGRTYRDDPPDEPYRQLPFDFD